MILKLRTQTYSIPIAATTILKPGTQPRCNSDRISPYNNHTLSRIQVREWIIAIIIKTFLTAWDKWTYRIGLQDATNLTNQLFSASTMESQEFNFLRLPEQSAHQLQCSIDVEADCLILVEHTSIVEVPSSLYRPYAILKTWN